MKNNINLKNYKINLYTKVVFYLGISFVLILDYYPILSIISLLFSLFLVIKFIEELGEKIAIRELITFIAALQWLIAPVFSYRYLPHNSYTAPYLMMVSENEYFSYVLPAMILFYIGLNLTIKNKNINKKKYSHLINTKLDGTFGKKLIIISIITSIISPVIPVSLSFLVFLLENLKYVGLYYILFSDLPKK